MVECPGPEKLEAYRRAVLPSEEADQLRGHVMTCPHCTRFLRTTSEASSADLTPVMAVQPQKVTAPAASSKPLSRGDALGRYLVLDVLGMGGMGIVYAAFDPTLDRQVALKLLHLSEAPADANGRVRLLREAQAMAKLSHPNVLTVHDVGTLPDGDVYLAMDLVEGTTLKGWLKEKPRSWKEVREVMLGAGAGLWAAHKAGLVHRDFKPDNVLVHKDGRVFVTDFGLAKSGTNQEPAPGSTTSSKVDEPSASASFSLLHESFTLPNQIPGTPAYMAPEQFKGIVGDALTDQFSFGVTLYSALYGEKPFEPRTSVDQSPRLRALPKNVEVPPWLRKVALKCIAEKREERFADMGEVLSALGAEPWKKKRAWLLAGALTAMVVAVSVVALQMGKQQLRQCEGVGDAIFTTWNPDRARELQKAFLSTGAPNAQTAFELTVAAFDMYAASWRQMRQDACTATRLRGEQSDEVLSLRMQCLDQGHSELRALVDVLRTADAETVAKSTEAAAGLQEVRRCADIEALRRPVRPPKGETQASEVAALKEKIAQARAQLLTGKIKAAEGIVAPLQERAAVIGYRPLSAEILGLLADVRSGMNAKGIEELYEDALWTAEAGNADDEAARIALSRLRLESNLRREEGMKKWLLIVDALSERLGRPDDVEALRLTYELPTPENPEHDLQSRKKALGLLEKIHSGPHPDIAETWVEISRNLFQRGRFAESLEASQQAVAMQARLHGPNSPRVGYGLLAACNAQFGLALFDEALKSCQDALSAFQTHLGDDALVTQVTRLDLGEIYRDLGTLDLAQQMFERAWNSLQGQMDPTEGLMVMLEEDLASTELLQGAFGKAETRYRKFLAYPPSVGTHPDRLKWRLRLAQALLGLGQAARAEAELNACAPELLKMEGPLVPETRFAQARLDWAKRRPAPEIQKQLAEAEAGFTSHKYLARAADVRAWAKEKGL